MAADDDRSELEVLERRRSAFSGKALAIIQSTSSPGTITLKATSGTLAGSSVDIVTATP